MRKAFAAVVFFLLLTMPSSVGAFGYRGHIVVARIAWSKLSPEVRRKAEQLLTLTAQNRQRTFAMTDQFNKDLLAKLGTLDAASDQACIWADLYRPLARETATFHYVNIALSDTAYDPKFDPEGKHLVAKLEHFISSIGDKRRSDDERAIALMWVLHLLGDIHMPLHVFSNDDKGGNDVKIRYLAEQGGPPIDLNLHGLLDYGLLENDTADLASLEAKVRDAGRQVEEKALALATPVDWANANLPLALAAYEISPGGRRIVSGDVLSADYRNRHLGMLHRQLYLAGVRLAHTLNKTLAE